MILCSTDIFQAGVTAEGKLNGIRVVYYEDLGCSENDSVCIFIQKYVDSGKFHHCFRPGYCNHFHICSLNKLFYTRLRDSLIRRHDRAEDCEVICAKCVHFFFLSAIHGK